MSEEMDAWLEKKKEQAIKDISKNLKVSKHTLCSFGSLGLLTVTDLVECFYNELLEEDKDGK